MTHRIGGFVLTNAFLLYAVICRVHVGKHTFWGPFEIVADSRVDDSSFWCCRGRTVQVIVAMSGRSTVSMSGSRADRSRSAPSVASRGGASRGRGSSVGRGGARGRGAGSVVGGVRTAVDERADTVKKRRVEIAKARGKLVCAVCHATVEDLCQCFVKGVVRPSHALKRRIQWRR
jgi:hypothetical protein